jgi:Mce-associated membrane protein
MMSTDLTHADHREDSVTDEPDDTSDGRESAGAPSTPAPGGGRGRRDLVLVLAGLLVAVLGLGAWWFTQDDAAYALAEERDALTVEATQAIEVLNTLDHREIEEGIADWRAVATGTLADQLGSVTEDEMTLLAEQQKISTGTVLDAAVLDLDDDTATVLAAVEVSVVDDSGDGEDAEPEVKRNRFSAELEKVDGEWKLASLQQVPVSL